MKLLQIVPTIDDEAMGPSYSVVRLCDELVTQGAELELCTLRAAPRPRIPAYHREFAAFEPARKLGISRAMRRHVIDGPQQYDIVHVHSVWMMPGIYGAAAAARRGVPLVTAPRGSLSRTALATGTRLKPLFWHLLLRRALARTQLFHATCEAEADDIRNIGFRQPVAIIPNGVDVPQVQRAPAADGRRLLYLGRIHPIKGLPMLLEAWRSLSVAHPEWSLDIVGPGAPAHVRRIRELAANLGLQRVRFHDPAFGADKWRHYAAADLFVLPTHSENFGMTVAESLACGTPVVTTRGAPWAGVVDAGCGWWCDIGTAPLHDALSGAMRLPRAALETMGRHGRDWMRRDFSWASIATRMLQSYRWIAGSGGDRPAWIN